MTITECCAQCAGLRIIQPAFNTDHTLTGGGNGKLYIQMFRDAGRQFQSVQAGAGQYDGVVMIFIKLAQTRFNIAAQGQDGQIRAQRKQLTLSAQTCCTDSGAVRQVCKSLEAIGDKCIAGIGARQHTGQGECIR